MKTKRERSHTMASKSLQRALGAIVLAFESFIVFFGTLVSFGLKVAQAEVVWAVGLTLGIVIGMQALVVMLGWVRDFVDGWLPMIVAWGTC